MAVTTHRLDAWLYRGGRPNRLARALNDAWARLAALGIGPARLCTLDVEGRRTHRTVSLPVVVADHGGERYLVSMLGDDTNWVRNVRAAGGEVVLRRNRHREHVRAEEVPVDERAPILKRYLECAPGARAHIPVDVDAPIQELERIAPDFPVFRIVPTDPAR